VACQEVTAEDKVNNFETQCIERTSDCQSVFSSMCNIDVPVLDGECGLDMKHFNSSKTRQHRTAIFQVRHVVKLANVTARRIAYKRVIHSES